MTSPARRGLRFPCPHHSDVALSLSAGTRALGTMTSSRAPRTMWTDDEITTLLALVNEKKLSDLLDSKRQKNKDILMDLERCLKEQGLTWTWEQIRTCWKNLKKRLRKPIEILLKNVYRIPIEITSPQIENSSCKDLTVQSKSHRNQISQTG